MSGRKKNILWLTYGLPCPADRGAAIRYFNLMRQVAVRHRIVLFALLESRRQAEHVQALSPLCDRVEWAVMREGAWLQRSRSLAGHLARGRPLATWAYCSDELEARLADVLATGEFDLLQIEHSMLAPYVEALATGSRCRTILSFHNHAETQYRSMLSMRGGASERIVRATKAFLMRGWEASYAARFDRCLTVSELDASRLRAASPTACTSVIPNGVDTVALRPLPEASSGQGLLFVGNLRYAPNVDAVRFLARDILPGVRAKVPTARLVVVGDRAPRTLRELQGRDDVILAGRVPDPVPLYQQARVALAPLRAGGGTRLKILEAMALGRPVVSTVVGCEGLAVTAGDDILIADDAAGFVDHIVRLLRDRELAGSIATRARALVEREYDWAPIGLRLLSVYDDLLAPSPSPGGSAP